MVRSGNNGQHLQTSQTIAVMHRLKHQCTRAAMQDKRMHIKISQYGKRVATYLDSVRPLDGVIVYNWLADDLLVGQG